MTKRTTTPRIDSDTWEKSKELARILSVVQNEDISAKEANRRSVELAFRNMHIMEEDAKNKRRFR